MFYLRKSVCVCVWDKLAFIYSTSRVYLWERAKEFLKEGTIAYSEENGIRLTLVFVWQFFLYNTGKIKSHLCRVAVVFRVGNGCHGNVLLSKSEWMSHCEWVCVHEKEKQLYNEREGGWGLIVRTYFAFFFKWLLFTLRKRPRPRLFFFSVVPVLIFDAPSYVAKK